MNGVHPDDYVQFVNKLMDGEFPIGRYVITGKTDFYIETDGVIIVNKYNRLAIRIIMVKL